MPRRSYKNSPSKKSAVKQSSAPKRSGDGARRSAPRSKAKSARSQDSISDTAASDPDESSGPIANARPTQPPRDRAAVKPSGPKKVSGRDKPQRLQRLLAAAGFGSRRQCESMIEEGRVDIDGTLVTELGTNVDPSINKVRVDGVPLRQQKLVYYAVNKPTGFLSTNADPRGRQRVIELVPNSERVFPVGRLDQSSQGLMLLTNDGDLAQQLAHPKYGIRKVYRVTVAGKIDAETMNGMRKGVYISDGFVRVEGAKIVKSKGRATELEIILREGKNREIRRILARLGHKVQVLRRVAIGPLRLGDLPIGQYRMLSRDEVRRLRMAIEHSQKEFEQESESKSTSGTKRTTKKKIGSKKYSKKKSGGKSRHAETRADVTARRTSRAPATAKFSFKPTKKKQDGGSVIGGD